MDRIEKNKLLLQMAQVRVKLPKYAVSLFFEKYPEHSDIKAKVTDVYNGRQVDRLIIEKFESLIK